MLSHPCILRIALTLRRNTSNSIRRLPDRIIRRTQDSLVTILNRLLHFPHIVVAGSYHPSR